MQWPRPERKDSGTYLRSPASTPQVDVIALTKDRALLATLREAANPALNLLHAETAEAAVDLLVGGHCGIFIVDIGVAGHNAVELIGNLQRQFPEVLLLATGRRDEQQAVVSLVGSGHIYRFLHKPVSPARAELFLSTAARRYGELHPHDARSRLAAGAGPLMAPRHRTYALIAVALIAIGALGGWIANRDREVVPSADANDEQARADVERIVAALEQDTREALAARDAPRARIALATLQQTDPNHPQLDELQAALLSLARQASATPARPARLRTATAPAARAPTTPQTPNIGVARAFLATGQLTEPPDSSTLSALRNAREAGEDEGAIQIVATALGMRLLDRALDFLDANDTMNAKAAYETAASVEREFETALPDIELVASRIRDAESAAETALP